METANKKPENPSAFPFTIDTDKKTITDAGMGLRDYFANSAMCAHLSTEYGIIHNSDAQNDLMLAKRFYDFADAMLKQREL